MTGDSHRTALNGVVQVSRASFGDILAGRVDDLRRQARFPRPSITVAPA